MSDVRMASRWAANLPAIRRSRQRWKKRERDRKAPPRPQTLQQQRAVLLPGCNPCSALCCESSGNQQLSGPPGAGVLPATNQLTGERSEPKSGPNWRCERTYVAGRAGPAAGHPRADADEDHGALPERRWTLLRRVCDVS